MRNERYYYGSMPSEYRVVYKKIFDGIKMRALNIIVPCKLSTKEVQDIYTKVLYDNPHFFYINQRIIKMSARPGEYILIPEYLYYGREIDLLNQDIRNVIKRVDIKARTMTSNQFRLEKYLHDTVVKSVAYDYDALRQTDCYNAHSILGAFLDKKAVCEGIAKAFKLLCNEYNMKCIVVLGKANQNGDFSGDCYHAWNLVKVGEESYHVDVTWDNNYENGLQHISYDYFNVTTKDILMDHQPMGRLPICTSNHLNYFHCTNSIVSNYEELSKLVEQRFNAKKIMFRIDQKNSGFASVDEVKIKTHMAIKRASIRTFHARPYRLLVNESHMSVVIMFL